MCLKATVWNCLKFHTFHTISNKGRFPMCLKATVWNCLKFHTFFFAFFCWTAEHSEFSVERRETSERTSFSQHWEGAFRFCGTEGAFACVVEDVSKYWYSPSAFWTFGESGAKDSFSGSLSAGVFSCVRWGPVLGPFLRYNVTNSNFLVFLSLFKAKHALPRASVVLKML